MKAKVIRLLFGRHSWMGVVLGLLMLTWRLSGCVMIFVPYPATPEKKKSAERHHLKGAQSIWRSSEHDEFTTYAASTPIASIWQMRLNDMAKTMPSTSGEVKQISAASQRFWSWLGAIPHWLYFTELKRM